MWTQMVDKNQDRQKRTRGSARGKEPAARPGPTEVAKDKESAKKKMATPDANGRREYTPGTKQEECAQGRGRPGRKPKELPPDFERVVEGKYAYWLAPDKTKCTKWLQVIRISFYTKLMYIPSLE